MSKVKLVDLIEKPISGEWGSEDENGNGIPVLRTTNFTNTGEIDYSNVVTRDIRKKNITDKYLQKGDIIIEKSGGSDTQPVGRVVYFEDEEDKYLINNFTSILRIGDQSVCFPKYLFYSLFFNYQRGGTIPFQNKTTGLHNLKTNDYINSYEVNLILFDKQKEIVYLLDKVKHLIDVCNITLEKLDTLVKSRFVEMFGTIQNNVYGYPIVKLGSCIVLQGGFAFKSKDFVENGIPIVQIGNVNKDYLNWDIVNYVPENFVVRYSQFLLKENDLVMAMTRPIIKSNKNVKIAKVKRDDLPCLLNQRVGRFQLRNNINHLYIEELCKMDEFRNYVERMSGNSLQPNISSKQVEDYLIILPPIELQNQFADFVAQVDKQKETVKKSFEKLETLKKSLMQEYFG